MGMEWKNAADMAEYAEALGITTTQVFAVRPGPETIVVLFTQTTDPDEDDLWSAGFARDIDGILRQTIATRCHKGMFAEMREGLDAHMREQFGDPEWHPRPYPLGDLRDPEEDDDE